MNTIIDQHEHVSTISKTTKLKYNFKPLDADGGTPHMRNLERSWTQVMIAGSSDGRML